VDEWVEWIFDNKLISTHPASLDRARAAAAKADYPTEIVLNSDEWQALKSVCKEPG
jgi:hypothetical protein